MSAYGRLYFGHVAHRRLAPIRHTFRYRIFSLVLDIDKIENVARTLRFFSCERFNLFSFRNKDHGTRDGAALRPWVESMLRDHGLTRKPARIELLCFPRILGHVFNPLSIYFCLNDDGELYAIVYEVKNTFGGQHCYVAGLADAAPADAAATPHTAAKAFYVSPFVEMEAKYAFTASLPGERLHLTIAETDGQGEPLLWAGWFGQYKALTDANLLKAFFCYPLMTLKVVGAIHWEALRLVLKGAKYRAQPSDSPADSSAAPIVRPTEAD